MAIFGGMKEWATVSQIFMFDIHSIYIIIEVDLIFIITVKKCENGSLYDFPGFQI